MADTPLKLNLHADGLAAVWLAKSQEETRYYLNGVYVTPWMQDGTAGVLMVATNGHLLAAYFDQDGEANRSAIIDGPFGSTMFKSGRTEKTARRLSVDGEIGRITATDRRGNVAAAGLALVSEIHGTYPNFKSAIKFATSNGTANFTWSHLIMERVCKIAQRLNGPAMRQMDVHMPERDGPTLFTFGTDCPLMVIAMPMRGNDAQSSVAWSRVKSGEAIDAVSRPAEPLAAE
jgi:hypothetical protein